MVVITLVVLMAIVWVTVRLGEITAVASICSPGDTVELGVAVGLLSTVLGLSLAGPAVKLLGAQEDVIGLGTAYLQMVSSILI
ncbi:MAG: hypothetical protein MUO62_00190, partial [Anaerolineales bacterium]|nr:hypothetical protein [Anaerolineales bacterium]